MSKVVRQDLDNLNAVLQITIEASDYSPKLEEELQKHRKKAQIKGFRAGKAPMAIIKKLYGRSFLADLINNQLQEALYGYIRDEKIELLGQPIASADQEDINFDLKEVRDFVFRFDVGLAPEFEVKGVDADSVFQQYTVEISPERIQEEVDLIVKQSAVDVAVEGDIQAGDLLHFSAQALDADGAVNEAGHHATFSVLFEDTTPALQQAIQGKSVGTSFPFNIHEVEKDRDEAFVRRYLLQLEPEDTREVGTQFELTLEKATRKAPAEQTQAFFDAIFGPDQVHDDAEMRDRIRISLESRYDAQGDAALFRQFQDRLLEANPLTLPDAFLRRWILEGNEKANEALLEKEYPIFAKNLQWTLIRNKLATNLNISVQEEEVLERFKDQVRGYFGGYSSGMIGEDFIQNMAERLMQDEKQVEKMFDDLLIDKLHDAIKGMVTIQRTPISEADFKAHLDTLRSEAAAAQTSLTDDEDE